MLLTFSKFFNRHYAPLILEMDQENIDNIEDSIMNIEERPFPELFGNNERFIEKVYSPEFIELCKNFTSYNLKPKGFDMENGFYTDSKGKKYRFGELFKLLEKWESGWEPPERVQKKISQLKQMLNQKTIFSYMVFSRHPIDVLRMSDINEIESCHSRGRGYFDCAKNEAKNLGGVAYVIDSKDAKQIKDRLNDREIFEDPERGIKGIKAKARIRLRRFINDETGEDFAVPERTYYIPRGNVYGYEDRYIDDLLQYTQDHQRISKEKFDPDYIERNISHVGGQYTDTEYNDLLGRFFGIEDHSIGEIKSLPSIPLTNKKLMDIIQGIEKSNNPEELIGDMDANKAFSILHKLEQFESKGELEFPKTREYILDTLNTINIDLYDHRGGLRNIIKDGTDISKYPNLINSTFNALNDVIFDLEYPPSEYTEEHVKNFVYKNSDGIKNFFKKLPVDSSSFYRIRLFVEPLSKFLRSKGDPTDLVNFMKQYYFEKMSELDVANRNNFEGFETSFGTSLFHYLDKTNQWEEFLSTGGGFYPYEDWISTFSPRREMLNYPMAIQTALNLINKGLDEDSTYGLTYANFISNNKFTEKISDNYNILGNIFENVINKLVTSDMDRITKFKYYLNIGNLIKGNSALIGEELEKYKQIYIDAFRNVLLKRGKYITDDYFAHIVPVLNKLRDNYGWYELKNLEDGPLDIIDDIIRSRNQNQNPNDDIKI